MSTAQQPLTSAEAQPQVQFGYLVLAFTADYQFRWNDRNSGASHDVTFWHPIPPSGFYALGSIGLPNYNDLNDPKYKYTVASLCVKPSSLQLPNSKPALARPVDYTFIWDDKGSGASHDGSCWRPIPPSGYVALGDVFNVGYNKPSLNDVMCVARELVYEGAVGDFIYNDKSSGANRDFSAWQIQVTQAYHDFSDGLIAVNSFVGAPNYSTPVGAPVVNTLRLPCPVIEFGDPAVPQLTSKTKPENHTNQTVDRIVTVPYTAIADPDKTIQWIIQNSPFYTVQRSVYYDLLIYDDNGTSTEQKKSRSVTTGVTTTQSETFSINTGITVGYESGVSAGGFSTKMSVQLSLQLGYSTTSSVAVMQSETQSAELTTPPQTAAALWLWGNDLRAFRADGTPVSNPLAFDAGNTAYVSSQYPPPSESVPRATYSRTRIINR